MSAVLAIALKDLRQRLRDRSAIVLGFIAPLAVAWLISMAFGSVGSFHADVAVVDIAGYLAILATYAVVLLAIASFRLRRSLVTP